MPDIFEALADPTRRAILAMLSGQQLPAGAIAQAFPQRRPAISKHLAVLRQAGLIEEARYRQQRLYSIRTPAFERVSELICSLRSPENAKRPQRSSQPPEPPADLMRAIPSPPPDFDPETD